MMVPHGVRRTGSQELRPVTIVVAFAFGGPGQIDALHGRRVVSSSHTNRWVGWSSSGQSAIWSAAERNGARHERHVQAGGHLDGLQVVGPV